ncbi:MAG TPA: UDP-N-acetylglucosamine 2-epimerase [Stellaceae bacterium]|nr:UDP-N-acetylglucosamine 2-epimerase [Stellaceae bacterium]
MSRSIAVLTGTRAEYGLLYWTLKAITADPALDLRLIVTGTHLEPKFGETVRAIESDGFVIDERIPLEISGDTPDAIAAALGRCVVGVTATLERRRPDLLLLLGDRYEILAAAEAACICRVPIAHAHGGELTEGATDDSFRHAITKLAHLHFAACEDYRRRIVQMGEDPARVFDVGALGLDAIERLPLAPLNEIEQVAGLPLGNGFFLVTYHPLTLAADLGVGGLKATLAALDAFPQHAVLITGVNADVGHDTIARQLLEYVAKRPGRARLVASLGQRRYLGAMRDCLAVVGNSSSGIIEAPTMKVPSVNIGDRQKGRLRAASVIDCAENVAEIQAAIDRAISPEFRSAARKVQSPYGSGGAAERIAAVLRDYPLDGLLRKQFHDIAIN